MQTKVQSVEVRYFNYRQFSSSAFFVEHLIGKSLASIEIRKKKRN